MLFMMMIAYSEGKTEYFLLDACFVLIGYVFGLFGLMANAHEEAIKATTDTEASKFDEGIPSPSNPPESAHQLDRLKHAEAPCTVHIEQAKQDASIEYIGYIIFTANGTVWGDILQGLDLVRVNGTWNDTGHVTASSSAGHRLQLRRESSSGAELAGELVFPSGMTDYVHCHPPEANEAGEYVKPAYSLSRRPS
jgi:hypothetical protein